ncbi:MAG: hypothetical protein H5U40_00580, partial [Polyangiaceae bacterium]|nr:hypothetical protein [Polyangiaceae bacterium]
MLNKFTKKWLLITGLIAIPSALAVVQASASFDIFIPPLLVGSVDRGYMRTELYRGASVPDEIVVAATPGDCKNNLKLEIAWDEAQNNVRVRLTGRNAL